MVSIWGIEDRTADSITLNRRYFALFPMLPAAAVPATPATDLRRYALGGTMFVANDQSAYVSYNWPLSVLDNNRRNDVGRVLSGFGVAEFASASIDVAEGAGSLSLNVFRRNGQAFDASVYAVPANGTAINGSDFNALPTGLFAVWLELGRPWRSWRVVRHGARSWMSREALVAPWVFVAVAAAWFGVAGASWAAALLALAFVYCQGRLLRAAKGIPAWREPLLVPLVAATALAEGAGAWLLLSATRAAPRPAAPSATRAGWPN